MLGHRTGCEHYLVFSLVFIHTFAESDQVTSAVRDNEKYFLEDDIFSGARLGPWELVTHQ